MSKKIYVFIALLIISMDIKNVNANDTAKSTIVMDIDTGRVLYEKNAHEKRLIASITKIMTAVIVIETADIEQEITVGEEILKMYGTNIYIELGEKMKIKDLLYGLLLRSGNDAATTLATNIAGSEEKFVALMNQKAKEIGMQNTTFMNPTGLDDDTKNFSTAYDMALLSQYAYNNNVYKEIAQTKKYSTSTRNKHYLWYNRNKLLTTYEYCTGGKNGYTPAAGKTLITTAERGNQKITIVTLNDPQTYENHKQLYENTFKKYKNVSIITTDQVKKIRENIYIKKEFIYPMTESEKSRIQTKIIFFKNKSKDNAIGTIEIKLDDRTIGNIKIYESEIKKEEKTLFLKIKYYVLEILKKLILGRQNNLKPGPFVPKPLDI